MLKFYFGKIIQYLLLIVVTFTLNFLLPRFMPGNPLKFLGGEDIVLMSSKEKQEILEKYGLDKSLAIQYKSYIKCLYQGDLGYSYQQKRPVSEIIKTRLPWTLLLTGINLLISTIIGVICGTLAAWKRGQKIDLLLSNIFVFFTSMPSFWVGMILVAIFGAELKWLPTYGAKTMWASYVGIENVIDIIKHLILPVITLVILSTTSIFLTMRYSMISILGEDYILMAKIKGLSDEQVKYKHVMRNALIPVVTVVMLNLGYMVGGATVVETVFAYPGMGRLLYEAVIFRDYPVIQGCFLIITLCVIFANLLADMLYPLIDPKVV